MQNADCKLTIGDFVEFRFGIFKFLDLELSARIAFPQIHNPKSQLANTQIDIRQFAICNLQSSFCNGQRSPYSLPSSFRTASRIPLTNPTASSPLYALASSMASLITTLAGVFASASIS